MRPCTGPKSTPARERWVEAASEASCRSTATRSGPAEWGSRRSDWDCPTAPMPVCATCSAAPERSCTERSWRPATGRMSTGQRRGEERRPCAVLKLDWAARRDPTGAPDRIASADSPCRADWTAASPWWMWSAATTTSMTAATAQITTRAITAAVILHRLVWRRRPGAPAGPDPAPRSDCAPPARRSSPRGAYCGSPVRLWRSDRRRVDFKHWRHGCLSGVLPLKEHRKSASEGNCAAVVSPLPGIVTFGSVLLDRIPWNDDCGGLAPSD